MNRLMARKNAFALVLTAVLIVLVAPFVQRARSQPTIRKVYAGGTTAPTYPLTMAGLQSAVNDSACGDTIYVQNGATLSGTLVLRQKGCPSADTSYITITSGIDSSGNVVAESNYPSSGVRIGPAYEPVLAKLVASSNNDPSLRTVWPGETTTGCTAPCVASYWKIRRMEFKSYSPWNAGAFVHLGTYKAPSDLPGNDAQNLASEIPHHLILDQVYMHGDPADGQTLCFRNSAKNTYVWNSYFGDCKSIQETQAISVINTTGPQEYINNYVEGSGENFMTGGGDPYGQFNATVLASPVPTTTSARLSACPELGTSATHQWFSIEVSGAEYQRKIDTINTSTCDITWTDALPGLPDQPGDADNVHWSWTMGGLVVEKNTFTKPLAWRNAIQATPGSLTATPSTTGGTLAAGTGQYIVQSRQLTTNNIYAQSDMTSEVAATTTGSTGSVGLTWTASANADEYRVYWRLGNATRLLATVAAPTTSYTHTSPTAGTAVVGTPQGASVTAFTTGGNLAAGTYYYRITARGAAGAEMPPTPVLTCTIASGTTGRCDFTWTAVTGATSYRIWGRGNGTVSGSQTLYVCTATGGVAWTGACGAGYSTTSTTFSDVGGGSQGVTYVNEDIYPANTPSVWTVKNTFELKSCDGLSAAGACRIKGNIIERSWVQGQTGMVVNIKSWNQDGGDDSGVIRNVELSYNIIRYGTRAITICAMDCDGKGSGVAEGITVKHNLIYGIDSTWGGSYSSMYLTTGWFAGAPTNRGGTGFVFDHNDILQATTEYGPIVVESETSPTTVQWTDMQWKNNIARKSTNGWHAIHNGSFGSGGEGTTAWNNAVNGTGRLASTNVFSDATSGTYSTAFVSGFYPTEAALQACFTNYAGGDYSLAAGCAWNDAGTDGTDIGADIATVNSLTAIASGGDNSGGGGSGGFNTPVWIASVNGGSSSAAVVSTTSINVTGTDRYMVCGTSVQDNSKTVSTVVFHGAAGDQSLTFRQANNFDNAGLQARAEYWDLVAPAVTSGTVEFTLNAATAVAVGCSTYGYIDPTTPRGTFAVNGASSNAPTVTATSAAGEIVVDVLAVRTGTTTLNIGTGQTQRVQKQSANGLGNSTLAMSDEAGAASVPMTWAVADSTNKSWSSIAVSLKPSALAGPPPSPLSLDTAQLPWGIVGEPYSFQLVATGGTAPLTFARVAGSAFPTGISMSTGGLISGTPTTSGVTSFTIRVTDAASATDDQVLSLGRLAKRAQRYNIDERAVYSGPDQPSLLNGRNVWEGDIWIDTTTGTTWRASSGGAWSVVGIGHGALPTCNAAMSGTLWQVPGTAGVKDSVSVCAKDATDTYAWRALY